MEEMILQLIPSLEGQTTLLAITCVLFALFFGSMVYSFIFGLFGFYRD